MTFSPTSDKIILFYIRLVNLPSLTRLHNNYVTLVSKHIYVEILSTIRLNMYNKLLLSKSTTIKLLSSIRLYTSNMCSVLCLLCLCTYLFNCALWSPAGKGLTSWLSFVVSYCEFVTFPLVSWVGCGTGLYPFLIFAPLLTFITPKPRSMSQYSTSYYKIIVQHWLVNLQPLT